MKKDQSLIALTQAQYDALLREARATAVPPQSPPRTSGLARLPMAVFYVLTLGIIIVALLVGVRALLGGVPVSDARGAPSAPATATIRPVAPQQPVLAPLAPQDTSAPVVEGAQPMPPTMQTQPTADIANISDVDNLANAADLAAGGNPGAATPVPTGQPLPTAVIGPIDPSGGDATLMARACANSGVGAACSAPAVAVDEQAAACAMDLAYGGAGCTPEPVANAGK